MFLLSDDLEAKTFSIKEPRSRSKRQKGSEGFLLLSLLTLSILICWTPATIYFTIISFTNTADITIGTVLSILSNAQSITDPILLTLSMKDIRESFKTIICWMH